MNSKFLTVPPEEYAKRAIEVLEEQLANAKTDTKIAKLKARIEKWKKIIQIVSDEYV